MKYIKSISFGFAILASSIILAAILSRYPGFFSLEWGVSGGRIELDGRPYQGLSRDK